MKISEFIKAFNKIVPLAAIGYLKDAVGLQVGFERNLELHKVLLAYEITDEVISEAIQAKSNLIISYHPLIFPNISSISDSTRTGSLIRKLIKNDIALYVIHTAFDSHPDFGTSRQMADALGLSDIKPILTHNDLLEKIVVFVPTESAAKVQAAMWNAGAGDIGNYNECSFSGDGIGTFRGNESSNPSIGKPHVRESVNEIRLEIICEKWKSQAVIAAMTSAHPYEEIAYDRYSLVNSHPRFGMGSMGSWSHPRGFDDVLSHINTTFKTSVLRHNGVLKDEYKRVAMVGGAGMEYYSAAKSQGTDIFITGDIRYHDFLRAEYDSVLLVDAGHAETERFVTDGMLKAAMVAANVVNLHSQEAQELFVQSVVSPNVVQYFYK